MTNATEQPTAQSLRDVHGYWGEHPDHPVLSWRQEVFNNDTRQGYWEWVAAAIEAGDGDQPESGKVEATTTTKVKDGTPEWVVAMTKALAKEFFANEGASHIRPCLNILEGQGAQAIEWHSGGGFMHAIGVIERDGLRVLFWTGIDAVGANSPAGDWASPQDGWQAMGHEDDDAPSMLVEISS